MAPTTTLTPSAPSAPSALSPSDRIMWRIENDAVLRSPILVVALLDREPDGQALRSTVARAVERVPRLRQCVRSASAGQRLVWADDEDFSLDYHLRRIRAPQQGDIRAVLDIAEPWATAALDPARPLWELTQIDGLEGGRAAFILKFHHTITDGVGGIELAEQIFDRDRHGTPLADAPEAGTPVPSPSIAARAVAAGTWMLGMGLDPRGTARRTLEFSKSLQRLLQPVPAPLSPVLVGRGLDRHLEVLELPLASLRDAAHAEGVTVNDLFLAAVGGGLHDYHERLGSAVPSLRVTMPISLRQEGDPSGGNRFAPARFVLPVDDPDPVQRARIASAIAQHWRHEPALARTATLATLLDRLPTALLTPLFGSMLKNVDVDAVDVPGITTDAFVGGARIDRMWAFAPPTGAALSITLLSHGDTACIGLLADLAAVTEPKLLATCLETALEEVATLGRRQHAHREVS